MIRRSRLSGLTVRSDLRPPLVTAFRAAAPMTQALRSFTSISLTRAQQSKAVSSASPDSDHVKLKTPQPRWLISVSLYVYLNGFR